MERCAPEAFAEYLFHGLVGRAEGHPKRQGEALAEVDLGHFKPLHGSAMIVGRTKATSGGGEVNGKGLEGLSKRQQAEEQGAEDEFHTEERKMGNQRAREQLGWDTGYVLGQVVPGSQVVHEDPQPAGPWEHP